MASVPRAGLEVGEIELGGFNKISRLFQKLCVIGTNRLESCEGEGKGP